MRSEGTFVSPQIEPTYKRFFERKRTPQQLSEMAAAIQDARVRAALALGLEECAEFTNHIHSRRRDKVTEMVAARFIGNMESGGFAVESNQADGLVCSKSMRNGALNFALILRYSDALMAGVLYPMFALTLSGRKIYPGKIHGLSVASFSPEVIVPEFYEACAFTPDSYAQMCLAVDSITYLCNSVCERVVKILCDAGIVLNKDRSL